MEVILREDYLALGYIGDTVNVRRGYARNFLIPRGIAVESSMKNDRELKHKLSGILAKRVKKKAEAEEFGKILQQVTVEFTIKVGAQGKSFGSITARDIETSLQTLGYTVDRRQIRVLEPIKSPGAHKVEVKLHSEVTVPLQIKVMAAAPVAAPAVEGTAKEKKGKGRSKRSASATEDEAATVDGAQAPTGEAETSEDAAE
jgi:large subunit ribosomal protein L9